MSFDDDLFTETKADDTHNLKANSAYLQYIFSIKGRLQRRHKITLNEGYAYTEKSPLNLGAVINGDIAI